MRAMFALWKRIPLLVRWLGIALLTLSWLYWSWCWGWWGQNKLLQYVFQCRCPAISEEARYPDTVDVVIPACLMPFSMSQPSPSGRYVSVRVNQMNQQVIYDEYLDELYPAPFDSFLVFLSDEFLLADNLNNTSYIYDKKGNKLANLTPVKTEDMLVGIVYSGSIMNYVSTDIQMQIKTLRSSYLYKAILVAWEFPKKQGIIISMHNFTPDYETENLRTDLKSYGVHLVVLHSGPSNVISPQETYLIGDPSIPSPMMVLKGRIWQPMLVKRVPLEQLAPEAQERVAAKRLAEANNRLWNNGVLTLSGILLIVIWLIESVVFTRWLWRAFVKRTVFDK